MTSNEVIEGDRLSLRPITEDDLALLASWDKDETLKLLVGEKFSGLNAFRDTQDWYQYLQHSSSDQLYGIVVDNTLIGDIELRDINWRKGSAEVRIRIGERKYWSNGYGTDALSLLIEYCFSQLSFEYLYLRVYAGNKRAIKSYKKVGFQVEGKLRAKSGRMNEKDDIMLMGLYRKKLTGHMQVL